MNRRKWLFAAAELALLALFVTGRFFVVSGDFLGYTCLFLAVVLAAYRFLGWLSQRRSAAGKTLRLLLTAGLCVFLAMFTATECWIVAASQRGKEPEEPGCLIVLGAGLDGQRPSRVLTERLQAALRQLERDPALVCIVSGCQGEGEEISEAEAMERWLREAGVAPERILREEQAADTMENLLYSQKIMEERGLSGPAGIVTSDFHVLRAELCAQRIGLEAEGISAVTELVFVRINYYIREVFGMWYYLIFR